ncbi:hypothetical protein GCM10025859_56720 [Alicyclobacillus fastidiosus]|nr:hypothetical protein GCM10025859_56720 [Alicyclobacillus fastidiosus]
MALRVPAWCNREALLKVNGVPVSVEERVDNGYVKIYRTWCDEDVVEWILPMIPELVQANPKVRANAGKVAIVRGPLVYCLEQVDNGENLGAVSLAPDVKLEEKFNANLFGGIVEVYADAYRDDELSWGNALYRPLTQNSQAVPVRAIPYYLWGNRGLGEMLVWIRCR